MKKNKGFTLIEILIVIVVIGITLTFALLSYGDFGAGRRILVAGDQLVNTLKLAQQQAQLEGSIWGLKISNTEFQLLKFHPPKDWSAHENKGIFKPHPFPSHTYVHMTQASSALNKNTPNIMIYSSGDMTASTIQLGQDEDNILVSIIINANGTITIAKTNDHAAKNE